MKKRILLLVLTTIITGLGMQLSTGAKETTTISSNSVGDITDETVSQNSISDINNVSLSLDPKKVKVSTLTSDVDWYHFYFYEKEYFAEQLEALDQIEDTLEWYLEYKRIVNTYKRWFPDDVDTTIGDIYSPEEIYYIERLVETETHGCSFEAHVNVANVVFNRIDSKEFPNTPIGVVTSPNQFYYGKTKITESVKLAVEYAYLFPDTTNGALFFHSGAKTKTFNGRAQVHEDDAVHYFYG